MIFLSHIAFGTALIALAGGTFLLLWSQRESSGCKMLGKIVAYVTMITAMLSLACTAYHVFRYRMDGYFNAPFIVDFAGMSHGMGKGHQCCDKDKAAGTMGGDAHGKECPMKKGMMMPSEDMDMDEMKEDAPASAPTEPAPSGHEHP